MPDAAASLIVGVKRAVEDSKPPFSAAAIG